MGKFVEYPKWKYAPAASPTDKIRSVIVANAQQERDLQKDEEWFDRPDMTNNTPEITEEAVDTAIPHGYEPVEFPKYVYSEDFPGGKLVNTQAEYDQLTEDHPGIKWSDTPSPQKEKPQMKLFGLKEDTDLNHNDPLVASDPVKLDQSETEDDADEEDKPEAKKANQSNKRTVKKEAEEKADKADEDLL